MENLELYDKVRAVPKEAQKEIEAGRMKGKTDINPMWRLKTLTEQFGMCGVGWKYEIVEKRLEQGANSEIAAFVDINLYVKVGGTWSEAIPGTGGSSFVAKERGGLYVSDECFKMALTDAISVACKALGFGADIYWNKDASKYDKPFEPPKNPIACENCASIIEGYTADNGKKFTAEQIAANSFKKYGKNLCTHCAIEAKKVAGADSADTVQ